MHASTLFTHSLLLALALSRLPATHGAPLPLPASASASTSGSSLGAPADASKEASSSSFLTLNAALQLADDDELLEGEDDEADKDFRSGDDDEDDAASEASDDDDDDDESDFLSRDFDLESAGPESAMEADFEVRSLSLKKVAGGVKAAAKGASKLAGKSKSSHHSGSAKSHSASKAKSALKSASSSQGKGRSAAKHSTSSPGRTSSKLDRAGSHGQRPQFQQRHSQSQRQRPAQRHSSSAPRRQQQKQQRPQRSRTGTASRAGSRKSAPELHLCKRFGGGGGGGGGGGSCSRPNVRSGSPTPPTPPPKDQDWSFHSRPPASVTRTPAFRRPKRAGHTFGAGHPAVSQHAPQGFTDLQDPVFGNRHNPSRQHQPAAAPHQQQHRASSPVRPASAAHNAAHGHPNPVATVPHRAAASHENLQHRPGSPHQQQQQTRASSPVRPPSAAHNAAHGYTNLVAPVPQRAATSPENRQQRPGSRRESSARAPSAASQSGHRSGSAASVSSVSSTVSSFKAPVREKTPDFPDSNKTPYELWRAKQEMSLLNTQVHDARYATARKAFDDRVADKERKRQNQKDKVTAKQAKEDRLRKQRMEATETAIKLGTMTEQMQQNDIANRNAKKTLEISQQQANTAQMSAGFNALTSVTGVGSAAVTAAKTIYGMAKGQS